MAEEKKVWGEIASRYPVYGTPITDVIITVRATTLEGAAQALAGELDRINATIEDERSKGTWH
jgi:hypothetical protein